MADGWNSRQSEKTRERGAAPSCCCAALSERHKATSLSLTQMAGACLNPSFEPRYPQPQEAVCATHTSQKRGQDGLSPTQPERWSGLLACDCGMMGGGSKRMCGEGGLAIPREALCVMRRRAPSCKNPVAPTQTNKQDE
jgi:hypothetical protein